MFTWKREGQLTRGIEVPKKQRRHCVAVLLAGTPLTPSELRSSLSSLYEVGKSELMRGLTISRTCANA
jgi:hypothetical protein